MSKVADQKEAIGPKPKRVPTGTIQLQFAGELILPRLPDKSLMGLFRRYEALFEKLANLPRDDRQMLYKFLNALMLTSYAKKTKDLPERKKLFELKNYLFMDIANNPVYRKKLAFKYLTTKQARVLKSCATCTEKNNTENTPRHKWHYCEKCTVDKNFYNVLSMFHKFEQGSFCLFISNELIPKVKNFTIKNKGKLDEVQEEGRFQRFHYTVQNLDAIAFDSVMSMYQKLTAAAKT